MSIFYQWLELKPGTLRDRWEYIKTVPLEDIEGQLEKYREMLASPLLTKRNQQRAHLEDELEWLALAYARRKYEPQTMDAIRSALNGGDASGKEGTYRKYTMGLREGGLMEDPTFHVEHVRVVDACTLREAKQRWAALTGHLDDHWNEDKKTYWGWEVVEL